MANRHYHPRSHAEAVGLVSTRDSLNCLFVNTSRITNLALTLGINDLVKATEMGCGWERDQLMKASSKACFMF
jgi:hypothetical protein